MILALGEILDALPIKDSQKQSMLEKESIQFGDIPFIFYCISLGESKLLDAATSDQLDCWAPYFLVLENLMSSNDTDIRNWVVVGILEGIQNLGMNRDDRVVILPRIRESLAPLTKESWDALHSDWGTHDEG